AAVDDGVARLRLTEVGAPRGLPDDLLPDERDAHRHAHRPRERDAGRGAVVEDEHLLVRRVGHDDREVLHAGSLRERAERRAARDALRLELRLEPLEERVAGEETAAL